MPLTAGFCLVALTLQLQESYLEILKVKINSCVGEQADKPPKTVCLQASEMTVCLDKGEKQSTLSTLLYFHLCAKKTALL